MTLKSITTTGMKLSDVLRLSMKKSEFEKTPYTFLPQGALDSIITRVTILKAMGITEPTPGDCELATYILSRAKRTFAIAAYIELRPQTLHKAMVVFRHAYFTDEKLPLEEMSGEEFLENALSGLHHPLVKLEGPVRHKGKRIWSFRRVHAFLEEQFKFLAPVISTASPDLDFGNLILPFVKKHAAHAEGSFGMISRYEIHSDHIQYAAAEVSQILFDNGCSSDKASRPPSHRVHLRLKSLNLATGATTRKSRNTGHRRLTH